MPTVIRGGGRSNFDEIEAVDSDFKTVKLENTTDTAESRGEGSIRWNDETKLMEQSDGTQWTPFALSGNEVICMAGRMGTLSSLTGPATVKFDDFFVDKGGIIYDIDGSFTVPEDGTYRVAMSPFISAGISSRILIGINTLTPSSGEISTYGGQVLSSDTAAYESAALEATIDLFAGDFVCFYIVTGTIYNGTADRFNEFSIAKLSGAKGIRGIQGIQGDPGIGLPGDTTVPYNPSESFDENVAVIYGGQVYYSLTDENLGNQPDISPLYWVVRPTSVKADSAIIGSLLFNGAVRTAGALYGGEDSPVNELPLNYDGEFKATRVLNAVWNDIADFIEVEKDTHIKYGMVYVKDSKGHHISKKKAELGIVGLASDTYGFGVGKKESGIYQIPIAIGGFVLAYVDKIYLSGTALTCSKNGGLTKASLFVKMFYPERIIATFYKEENKNFWNELVLVNGRHWVKVK